MQHGALHLNVEGRQVRVEPGQVVVLGRGQDVDITINNPDVSRRHAQVLCSPTGWQISDLGSSNGTFVDGHRVMGTAGLRPGSVVVLGGGAGAQILVGVSPVSAPREEPTAATLGPQHGSHRSAAPLLNQDPTGKVPTPSTYPTGPTRPGQQMPTQLPGGADQPEHTMSVSQVAARGGSTATNTGPIRLPKSKARVPDQIRNVGEIFDSFEATATGATAEPGTVVSALPQVMPQAEGTITIGRGLENEIVLKDLLASRRHAQLTPTSGGYLVQDLNSRNGTFINGSRVSKGTLREGDLLTVGRARFTIKNGALVASQDEGNVNFVANHLSFTLPDGKKLLDDISFGLDGSSLVAVIGPSGAGKSTLLKALIGAQKATEGDVFYDGRDLYANYDDLRQRIGVVPQDDVVHHQLTVRQALRYAAELRFPDDLPKADREQRVEEVIEELGLTNHADTQVARLSGGQRKRTSVALELLTSPSLLFLDEPTSGLDPGLDKRVMTTLRNLADGGRTVVVITHNVASLGICDRVLLLAPGGKVAYFGPPREILPYFFGPNFEDHERDFADVFNAVTDDPDAVQRRFATSPLMESNVAGPLSAPRPPAPEEDSTKYRQQSIPRQLSTLVRRQLRATAADKGFLGFSLVLPIVLALLVFMVPGTEHFAVKFRPTDVEPQQIMVLLTMGSIFMGLTLTIRELVAERPIYMREKAVGLSPFAYVLSKCVSGGLLLLIQCLIMVGITAGLKGMPEHPMMMGSGLVETFFICYLTGMTSLALGLALSSFARTSEQVMPMLVITMMGALVFSGALFELTDGVLKWLSMISPSRWAMALAAQTADLHTIMVDPRMPAVRQLADEFWQRDHTRWLIATGALCAQLVISFLVAWVNSKRRKTM